MTNSLLFFNKHGYPHNFQYNKETEGWEGKIIFDENSDQTFKTQSLHIFENVDPIEFEIQADLVAINYNNNSGLTIAGETTYTSNQDITDIIEVNDSTKFYSKWIFGTDFHKKFPVGTVIHFSGVTGSTSGSTDFDNSLYFTVLGNKKNAFLIVTKTVNNSFNFKFLSGQTSSLNMISINDYNRNLSGTTFFQNLYTGKTFSIINSNYNDSVISIKKTGITYSYLNELQLNGFKDQIFNLRVELLTERPKITQGDFKITESKYINLGRSSLLLAPEVVYDNITGTTIKKEIIFEDNLGNKLFSGFTFVVDSLVTSNVIANKIIKFKQYYQQSNDYKFYQNGSSNPSNITQWNTIQFSGYTSIRQGDVIILSGVTGSTLLMDNREFSITQVTYNSALNYSILFTPGYIIDESGSTYTISQKLQPHQISSISVTSSGGDSTSQLNDYVFKNAICYLTTNYINFTQNYVTGSTSVNSSTIDAFINKYKSSLFQYGVDVYHSVKNNNDYLSIETLYGASTPYIKVTGYTNNIKIKDDDFSLSISGTTVKYNMITNEKLLSEKTNKSDNDLYKNEISTQILLDLNADTPTEDHHKLGFRLTLNGIQYSIGFSGDTQHDVSGLTINSFINTFGSVFAGNSFTLSSGYSLVYSGYTLNISSDVDIYDLQVMVNILSTYKIIETQRNKSILLSGNEIRTNDNLFNSRLATGMIVQITGSSFSENNKEYNIIGLTQHSIDLSYQGFFTGETDINIGGSTRDFIRKPRGVYNDLASSSPNKDICYKVYWNLSFDNVVDNSIFLYDISGEQLTPYNNNPALSYINPDHLPLIDSATNNVVFLNTTQNSDLTKINNPKFQQTVFDELNFKLEQLNPLIPSDSFDWMPAPLEIFIGYNSPLEGVNNRVLKIDKIEKIQNSDMLFSYSGTTSGSTNSTPNIYNFILNNDTLTYNAPVDFSFITYGFEAGQIINIDFKEPAYSSPGIITTGQTIHENIYTYRIQNVFRNKILIDTGYTNQIFGYETGTTSSSTGFTYFTTTGKTFLFKIEVQPKEILSCQIYGQTEIEDIRYKVNLNNLGIQSEEEVYQILYQSDIEDNAIDYTLFNRKRKELLTDFREIYDYIGSYKSLIRAINYFGYNNLQLFEYYKNIDKASPLYTKLHKVLIPDIFDNTVPGWNETDYISGKYQNQNIWKKTNLFNLAYQITDEDGNNVLIYSLDEVQYKLTKLKTWLRKNIIPISSNLLDITGVADTTHTLYQDYDESNQTMKAVVERNSTVVNFNYTATLNFGSDYLITVNFYTMSGTTLDNNTTPASFSAKIKTFFLSGSTIDNPTDLLVPVQYLKINKNDLTSFSFTLNKYVDPYLYIETTTYDNDGCGLGYVNNKLFYYDEPRNYWLVNNNFDLSKMKYWQTSEYISNDPQKFVSNNSFLASTIASSSVETIVKVNTLNNTYLSQIGN